MPYYDNAVLRIPNARSDTILCALCRCTIRDALTVSQQWAGCLSYAVRIDDRIPASCCPETAKLQRLQSSVQTLYEYNKGLLNRFGLGKPSKGGRSHLS